MQASDQAEVMRDVGYEIRTTRRLQTSDPAPRTSHHETEVQKLDSFAPTYGFQGRGSFREQRWRIDGDATPSQISNLFQKLPAGVVASLVAESSSAMMRPGFSLSRLFER